MGKGTPHSIGGTCGLRLVVYSFLDEHGSTNMGALVSDVWNGIRWDLHPARSEKQVRLMAFISLLSPQDRADSASWIMDGNLWLTYFPPIFENLAIRSVHSEEKRQIHSKKHPNRHL
ncbi:hypothetical protein Bca4012_075580 [Brassica carinata]